MRRFLLAAIVLFTAAPVTAQSTQEFRSTAAGYRLQLPAQWRRLPDEQANVVRRAAAQLGMTDPIEAVYRVTESPTLLPMVTVATLDLGERMSRQRFREEMTGADARAGMQSGADIAATAERSGRMGVPMWDEENGAVWTRGEMQSGGRSSAFAWTVAMLHPGGRKAITLTYTGVPGEDEARIRADLLAIVRSLRVD